MTEEIHKLDHNADSAFDTVNARFQSVLDHVEAARQEALGAVRDKRDEKKRVLDEQLQIIQAEKTKVDTDVKVKKRLILCCVFTPRGKRNGINS